MAEPLSVGKTVGRFELLRRLGHGGMAAVFLGRATGPAGFEKLVAVKVIHPQLAEETEFVDMFLDEARIAARLHHPHVVEIHDASKEGGVPYMVMEYVEGETLAALLRQLRKRDEYLPLPAVLQVIADTCGGLAAAHEQTDTDGQPMNLVHRDVSPHNLLVDMDGRVKVVDFGIAKATGRRSVTRTGQLRGKLAYMSPEQASGEKIDHRTDLFAVGSVLWELLTNKRLFVGETEAETLARVSSCKVPDIREIRDDLPPSVIEFVDKALARDPDDRFPTAQHMLRHARTLLRALSGDEEPREELAAVMKRLFSERIEYVRNTIRQASESGPRPELGTSAALSAEDATRQTEHADAERSGSNPMHSTGSQVALARNTTGVQTLTTSLATAPARHWSLWLLLPLVGAVAGAAIVTCQGSGIGSGSDASPSPSAAVQSPTQRPTLASADSTRAPPPSVPTSVRWTFNVEPEGSMITLDGKPYPRLSPSAIDVLQSDEPVEITISKHGYETLVLHRIPGERYTFVDKLTPVAADSETEDGSKPRKRGPWLKARTKKKPKPEGPAKDTSDAPKANDPDSDPEPAPMPDFDALLEKESKKSASHKP